MTAGAAFWLITWGVLWWHLCRWLIRLVLVSAAAGAWQKMQAARAAGMEGGPKDGR